MQGLVEFTTANPWLMSGLIASGLAVIFYELRLKARGIGSVSPAMAVQLINQGAVVVDIRDGNAYANGHITDARNIPDAELAADPEKLPVKGDKKALLVCDTGGKSAERTAGLRKAGKENVFSLKGGLSAWQQENLPLISGSKKS